MSDWEKELEEIDKKGEVTEINGGEFKPKHYADEHESIQEVKIEKSTVKTENKVNEDDYEEKWKKKNEEKLKRLEEQKNALKFLTDEEKQKKIEEMSILQGAADLFMGAAVKDNKQDERKVFLKNQQEFIDFGIKVASKINTKEEVVNKSFKHNKGKELTMQKTFYSTQCIYEFLKTSFEELLSHLDSTQITELKRLVINIFNKKREEEKKSDNNKVKDKSKGKAKAQINVQKGSQKSHVGYEVGDEEYYDEEEEY